MINRERLTIIILIACVGLIGVAIAIVVLRSPESSQSTTETTNPFYIDRLDDPKYLFSVDTRTAIVKGVEQYLKKDNVKTDKIKGAVRENSYTKKEVFGSNVVTLLIDIPDAKRTYKISSSGSGNPNGDNSLYILCPSQEELIYSAFDCKDDSV